MFPFPALHAATRRRALAVAMLLVALPLAPCAHAQSSQDEIRSIVRGARLGTAYAQMVNLAATPDVSAASYDIDDPASDVTLDVIRLPYQARWLALAPNPTSTGASPAGT